MAGQWLAMGRAWRQASAFVLRLMAVPLGLTGVVLLGWGLIQGLLHLNLHSRVAIILLVLAAVCLVVDALVAGWDRLPSQVRRRAQTSWRWRSRWLMRSRPLSLWPVVLVLLTSLLGMADWFPAQGWSRPMMLGLIASVGLYGYFREQADQKKTLLAFANVARHRFAEEAKRIHEGRDRENEARDRENEARECELQVRDREYQARDREAEARERSAAIDRLCRDLEDRFSLLKAQARALNIPFRDLVDTSELRDLLIALDFTPSDAEFAVILQRLGLEA